MKASNFCRLIDQRFSKFFRKMDHAVRPADDEVSSVNSKSSFGSQEPLRSLAEEEVQETIGLVITDVESQKHQSRTPTFLKICCKIPSLEISCRRKLVAFIGMLYLLILVLFLAHLGKTPSLTFYYPQELFDEDGAYALDDFRNDIGNIPPYWEDINESKSMSNKLITPHVGPCYLPTNDPNTNWHELMDDHQSKIKYVDAISLEKVHGGDKNVDDLTGLCRPGFIIIGAGKCGTSSLYHYLVGHPRVLPAKTKQIHYFKYFTNRPMRWYLSNFPPAQSFLSNGALMTGEASPGYLVSDLHLLFYIHCFIIFVYIC